MVQFTEGGDNVDDAFNRICDLGVVVTSSLFPCRPALFGEREKRATATLEERESSVRATRARSLCALKALIFYGSSAPGTPHTRKKKGKRTLSYPSEMASSTP